jgi:hypothetical protein
MDTPADRHEKRVAIDAIDLRLLVDPPDGPPRIAGSAAQIEHANGLVARERKRGRHQLEVAWLRGALLGPPQREQFVEMVVDPRVDLGLADGRGRDVAPFSY